MSKNSNQPEPRKIGTGHASAMLRQGLRELRGALYNESNVAQQPEYGLYGTMTPGEIGESRRSYPAPELDDAQRASPLQQSMQQAESRAQDRSPERDRSLDQDR